MSQVCNEVRFISQLSLDGVSLTRHARERALEHREQCSECMNFHQTLIQATALASDILTDEVFNRADMTSVSRKLKELIDELFSEESDHDRDDFGVASDSASPSIESRLQALLGAPVNAAESAPASSDREFFSPLDEDAGQLITRVERDGKIIETFLDSKGWTTTRIRSLAVDTLDTVDLVDAVDGSVEVAANSKVSATALSSTLGS